MFKGCSMVTTTGMTREQWLSERKKGIGGSDAAAVIGQSKWATPYTVYLDKLGILPDKEDNEALRQGRDLEEYVARRFTEETGKRVQRCNYMIRNDAYPFAIADIDRRVIGENAGLECKTTSTLDLRQFHGVEFPERYYVQCVHYLAVTGADRWYLALLVFGKEFHVYCLERDEAEITALMKAEAEFWEMVQRQEPPDVSGLEADSNALDAVYENSADREIDLLGMGDLAHRLKIASMALDAAKQAKDEIVNTIKDYMKTANKAHLRGYTITWKTQERRTLDVAALKMAYPQIPFDSYTKVSTSRPFRITAEK